VVTVTEDAEHQAKRLKEDAEHEAQRLQKDKVDEAEWLAQHITQDPELQQEWIRQDNLAYGGLIAIGIVLVQPFVAGASLDTSGMICAVAFAIAIPLLAALILVNQQETFRRRRTSSRIVTVARATAQASATVGVVAGSGTSTGSPAWEFWRAPSSRSGSSRRGSRAWNSARGRRPGPRKQPRSPRSPATPTRSSARRR
jgi:hypothetical protein